MRFRQLLLFGLCACSLPGVGVDPRGGGRTPDFVDGQRAGDQLSRADLHAGNTVRGFCAAPKGIYVNDNRLDVVDLNLTVFSGDASNRVESVFLSPSAVALIGESRVRGPGALRLITDDFEATGRTGSTITARKRFPSTGTSG